MKSIFVIILITISLNTYSADKSVLQARNQELVELFQKSSSTENHDKVFLYQSEIGNPGVIYTKDILLERIVPNILRIAIPNGLELRSCQTAPFTERIQIQNNVGQDYILISTSNMQSLKISCASQNLTRFVFISYKETSP